MLPRRAAPPAVRAAICALLLCLALSACGGSGSSPDPQPRQSAPQAEADTQAAPAAEALRNTLSTSMPALQRLAAGDEFSFVLSADFADGLFQGSGRVLYNSSLVAPVEAERGAGMPAGCIFMARTDAPQRGMTDDADRRAGFDRAVPLAFTGRPGDSPLARGRQELLRLRFRLLRDPDGTEAVRLKNNPEFLQMRDARGLRLPFNLETSSAVAR